MINKIKESNKADKIWSVSKRESWLRGYEIVRYPHINNDLPCNENDGPTYMDLGNCDQQCRHCGCLFWYNERLKGAQYTRQAEYHLCCGGGKIYMQPSPDPPDFIKQLLTNNHFMEHIRAYNQMFAMTSFGAKVDDSVNKGRGPYVFKISGQIYHWIGSLCPEEGDHPRCNAGEIHVFKIRLYNMSGVRGYELPTADLLRGIVFEDGPRRFYPELQLKPRDGTGKGKKVTMNAYYRYQLHPRVKEFGLIFRSGRLFQQYVVTVFCAVEQSRLDYIRTHQDDLRSDYLSGLYDAVSRGDHEGVAAGSKIILPRTFTGGPRYMYSHYLDALAICRSLGNPQFFITFTCNVKWPEI
ncbi:DNA helicase [Tanacetum coccineum]